MIRSGGRRGVVEGLVGEGEEGEEGENGEREEDLVASGSVDNAAGTGTGAGRSKKGLVVAFDPEVGDRVECIVGEEELHSSEEEAAGGQTIRLKFRA